MRMSDTFHPMCVAFVDGTLNVSAAALSLVAMMEATVSQLAHFLVYVSHVDSLVYL